MADLATHSVPSIRDWLAACRDLPRLDAELLLCHHLGITRAKVLASPQLVIDPRFVRSLTTDIERLRSGEPLAYVVGERGFWDFTLTVSADVLIPRPETETLVEQTLARLRSGDRVLDLGTGSGAIAIAVARSAAGAGKDVNVFAVDLSVRALEVAAANATRLGAGVNFRSSNWFDNVPERFDMIVANPPYVAEHDSHLAALRFEPADALISGPEGLDDLTHIIGTAPTHLNPAGWLLVEHGYDQADRVRALFEAAGFVAVDTVRDLGDQPRVTFGRTGDRASEGGI